MKDKSPSF